MQIDYEIGDGEVWKMMRSNLNDWVHNLELIQSWSPYGSEEELFDQVCVLSSFESNVFTLVHLSMENIAF